MRTEAKKEYGSTLLLFFLGVLALHFGANWLPVLIPLAILVWFGAGPSWRSGRN